MPPLPYAVSADVRQGQKVIVKTIGTRGIPAVQVSRFLAESGIIRDLKSRHIVQLFGIEHAASGLSVVELAVPDSQPLRSFFPVHDLAMLLSLGAGIAAGLEDLHVNQVVHRDITPDNIIVRRPAGADHAPEVFLSDCGLSLLQPPLALRIYDSRTLSSLPYLAPEQSERMNRDVDYRADLYRLGAILYEAAAGRPPFPGGDDPVGLLHAHMTLKPAEPREIDSRIPSEVSQIIMRLLSKNAEDRYQSARALRLELQACLDSVRSTGRIEMFTPGRYDYRERFVFPQKLYGRIRETSFLLGLFEESARDSPQVVFVRGSAGIGKSTIVNELQKPVTAARGIFAAGKYDQFRRDVPYSAIAYAFQGVVRQIISSRPADAETWGAVIRRAVAGNAPLIADVVPEISHLIGHQSSVAAVEPAEAENRFLESLQSFIQAFATPEHPLVLFLDDLQWADKASLNVLRRLASDPSPMSLLLILAFRDEEVDAAHPLTPLLDARDLKVRSHELVVTALGGSAVEEMVRDLFPRSLPPHVEGLSGLLLRRTGGNPFFMRELLTSLYRDGLVDYQDGLVLHPDAARRSTFTDNVLDLMAKSISGLPPVAREAVLTASCLGTRFYPESLAVTMGIADEELYSRLKAALDAGYLALDGTQIRFVHDRVREGAYSLLSAYDRSVIHYRAARSMYDLADETTLNDRILGIVAQLNLGRECVASAEEARKAAALNLQAGRKAMAAAGFPEALHFFRSGLAFLPADSWEADYELALALHTEGAVSEYVATNYSRSDEIIAEVHGHARSDLDRIRAFEIQIARLTVENRLGEALDRGREGLRLLGVRLPKKAGKLTALPDIIISRIKMRKKGGAFLENMGEMTGLREQAAMRLLMQIIAPAFISVPAFFPVIVLKMVRLSLSKGMSPQGAYALAAFALILGSGLDAHKAGYEIGRAAVNIVRRYGRRDIEAKILFVFGNMVNHWTNHLRTDMTYLEEGWRAGSESGELQYGAYCLNHLTFHYYHVREPVHQIREKFERNAPALERMRQHDVSLLFTLFRNFARGLSMEERPADFDGPGFDEAEVREHWERTDNFTCLFILHHLRMISAFLARDMPGASSEAAAAARYSGGVFGMPFIGEHVFISALALLGNRSVPAKRRVKAAAGALGTLKAWEAENPAVHGCRRALVEAEMNCIRGRYEESKQLYERAAATAQAQGFLLEEALALEALARMLLSRGEERSASDYVRHAHRGYMRFGLGWKRTAVETEFPSVFPPAELQGTEAAGQSNLLDLSAVIRATQALSGEIFLEKYTASMIRILMESAGADRGCLVFERAGELFLDVDSAWPATGAPGDPKVQESGGVLPVPMIRYVQRTGQSVVLGDATNDPRFGAGEYFREHRVRSVLCRPILGRGELIGILYLENSILADAFTAQRLELLGILSAQAAISLMNARLAAEEVSRQKLRREFELARQVQTSVLPRFSADSAYEFCAETLPADQVGGDYYDFARVAGKRWLAIGDVSGHGLNAGLLMLMAQSAFTTYLHCTDSPNLVDLFCAMNATLFENISRLSGTVDHVRYYMTCTVLCADDDGTISHVGLHGAMPVFRARSGTVESAHSSGMWLGIQPEIRSDLSVETIRLEKGDVLCLHTDGLTEAMNGSELYGYDRLYSVIRSEAPGGLDHLRRRMFAEPLDFGDRQHDDMTVLLVRKL